MLSAVCPLVSKGAEPKLTALLELKLTLLLVARELLTLCAAGPAHHLDMQYTIFGSVLNGSEAALAKMEAMETVKVCVCACAHACQFICVQRAES